jgi:2,3-bisphosphoglycerate-independent phosphoglycerate mutase
MRDAHGAPVTAHSLNLVPFLLAGRAAEGGILRDGVLADVAPTLCELAGLPRWPSMTGSSLLEPVPERV